MNYAEKMERENRLKTNLAEWMLRHGEVLSGRSRSNGYVGLWMVADHGGGRHGLPDRKSRQEGAA